MKEFDYRQLLAHGLHQSLSFQEFIEKIVEDPNGALHTSSSLIYESIKYFGWEIVVQSGEPSIAYNIFNDPFTRGVNAVFGQEHCIKQIVDVVESIGKESGPNRGIVLVGPPASGKTNIVDLISLALEEYTTQSKVKLYTFYFHFESDSGQRLDIRPAFSHNPVLLFPTILQKDDKITYPRQEFFGYLNSIRSADEQIVFPTYYQHANLDRRCVEILQAIHKAPRNTGKRLHEIIDEYIRVEEISFSNALAHGIANIDDMRKLAVQVKSDVVGGMFSELLSEHVPGINLARYEGALVNANRGLLHIHDAFASGISSGPSQEEYKPLLMLLGSGKASIESSQTSIDTTLIVTTNVEEMEQLERQLTSSKLLDRVEKIPVNYLLDAQSEMDILRRDLSNIRERYQIDPNLLRITAYYAVLTRLLPPFIDKSPDGWSDEKLRFFNTITPEQKLIIYSAQPEDPIATIKRLPYWHPFRNEAAKLGIDIFGAESYKHKIKQNYSRVSLDDFGLFSNDQLEMLDDSFMRTLWSEHYPKEGKQGISVRQLQNIMRNTIANSDGRKIHVGTFLSQLKKVFRQGKEIHHWLNGSDSVIRKQKIGSREVGDIVIKSGEGDYGDYEGLSKVVRALYYSIIRREITVSTVDREPKEIEGDLRRYLQHALLAKAFDNNAFAHIMIPKFSFIDPRTGLKVDKPDISFMESLEQVLAKPGTYALYRREMAQKYLDLQSTGELLMNSSKSLVASKDDNLLICFASEYNRLLSHRRTVEGIDPKLLTRAFIVKKNQPNEYPMCDQKIQIYVERILDNMADRFNYPRQIALDTISYAIRKSIVNFEAMIS